MKTLIIGGVRSGKSRLAEQMATTSALDVVYIATAEAHDTEMRERIAHHRARRAAHWLVVEEPIHLAATLNEHATPEKCLLVDCLTLWLTNLILSPAPEVFAQERAALLARLRDLPGHIILVTNETGLGITPLGELSRRFTNEAGWLHQDIAATCNRVVLTVAGLPLYLKGNA